MLNSLGKSLILQNVPYQMILILIHSFLSYCMVSYFNACRLFSVTLSRTLFSPSSPKLLPLRVFFLLLHSFIYFHSSPSPLLAIFPSNLSFLSFCSSHLSLHRPILFHSSFFIPSHFYSSPFLVIFLHSLASLPLP